MTFEFITAIIAISLVIAYQLASNALSALTRKIVFTTHMLSSTFFFVRTVGTVGISVAFPLGVDALEVGACKLVVVAVLRLGSFALAAGCGLALILASIAIGISVALPVVGNAALLRCALEFVHFTSGQSAIGLVRFVSAIIVSVAKPPDADALSVTALVLVNFARLALFAIVLIFVLIFGTVNLSITLPRQRDAQSMTTGKFVFGTRSIATNVLQFVRKVTTVVVAIAQPALRQTPTVQALQLSVRTRLHSTLGSFIRSVSAVIISITSPRVWNTLVVGTLVLSQRTKMAILS